MKYAHFGYGLAIGVLGSIVALHVLPSLQSETDRINGLRAQYYASEVATLVSPHSIRERMSHGDDSFILVDVRAQADYEREHIAGAINIDTSQALDAVLAEFEALPSDKQIIIYCYSTSCLNGRKAGNFLAQNDIFVQEMTIGWNEWRYAWEMWNYDTEWDAYSVEDYVVSGSEPGAPNVDPAMIAPCPIDGELSC